ncbi:MAG: sodium:solute symporter family protein [Bacteroidales bacterium]|nr:sodium:solute symporter family protein [Bacteroidales bacterium]
MSMKIFAINRQNTTGILVFATLAASFLGPGFTFGLSEQGFNSGLLFFFVYLGFTLQTILIGIFVAPKLRKYKAAYTVGDIVGFHYGKAARLFTGLISMLYCAGIVGIVGQVSGLLLQSTLNIQYEWGVILTTLVVVLYALGGMRTILFTDFFQFLMLALPISIFSIILYFKVPDISIIAANLPVSFNNPFNSVSGIEFIGLFAGFFLGETLVPPYTTRAFVSKDSKSAGSGFYLAGVFSLLWFAMVVSIGIIARALFPEINASDSFLTMANNYLPVGLLGFLMVAIISIVMSTQDTYLQSAAVSFVRDIIQTLKKEASEQEMLLYTRITTFLIGVLGVIFAINAQGIIKALLLNYTFWAPTIVLPLILAILIPNKVKPLAGLVSILTGGISVALWEWVFHSPFGISSLIVGVIMNQVGFWLIQLLVKSESTGAFLQKSSGCTGITSKI